MIEVAKLSGTLLLATGMLAAGHCAAAARSLQVTGTAGYLSEWELKAEATAGISGGHEEFSGPLTLKHVGLCSANGPEEKLGRIEFHISKSLWSSQINATLSIDGKRCSYSGKLSESSGFMDCSDGNGIPLTLLVK
jgi:hypothetical protein